MGQSSPARDFSSPVGYARLAFADRWLSHGRALFAQSALKPADAVVLLLDVRDSMGNKIVGWHERIEPRGRIAERIDEAHVYVAVLCMPIARRVFSGQPVVLDMILLDPRPGYFRLAAGSAGGWATMMVPAAPPPTTPDA